MNADELFLFTLDELEERLELGRPEYDALMAAWLVRKLLHNGVRSIVSMVAEPRGVEIRFRVLDLEPPPEAVGWHPSGAMVPRDGEPTVDLTQQEFLRRVAVLTPGRDEPIRFTVSDVIDYLANVAGAVHLGTPRDDRLDALAAALEGIRSFSGETTPRWQYSGGVTAIREIGQVTVAGLAASREQAHDETWPVGYPDELKGLGDRGVFRHDDGTIEFRRGVGEPTRFMRSDGTHEEVFPDGRIVRQSPTT